MVLALALHHHAGIAKGKAWVDLWTPPSKARMAVLVREELERRDRYYQEALAESRMTMADPEEDRWEPLGGTVGLFRGGW